MVPTFILAETRRDPKWVIQFFKQRNLSFEKLTDQIKREVSQGNIIPLHLEDLFVNVIGLCLFPILSQPLLMEFFFKDNENEFSKFMDSRHEEVKRIIHNWLKPD